MFLSDDGKELVNQLFEMNKWLVQLRCCHRYIMIIQIIQPLILK